MAIESQPDRMTGHAPRMFPRPTEALEPLESVRAAEEITRIHHAWAQQSGVAPGAMSGPGRLRAKFAAAVRRLRGRDDHELLGDLIRATDALAVRCDELGNRLQHQQVLTAELAESLGQEVTRLRAALSRTTDGHEVARGPLQRSD
jgi:hypothetical protein